MNTPSLLVDVREILEELGGTIPVDAEIELPSFTLGSEEFKPLRAAHVSVDVTNTGAGIVATGSADVTVEAVCSRCLKKFDLEVTAAVDGFYVVPGHEYEVPEEQEIEYIKEGSIDLAPEVVAALTLELPFAPLHAEDCPGICPTCGADLAAGPCGCEADLSSSPFAALKDILGGQNPKE